jgi:hypothetical protein
VIFVSVQANSGDFKGMLQVRPQEMYFREGFLIGYTKSLTLNFLRLVGGHRVRQKGSKLEWAKQKMSRE